MLYDMKRSSPAIPRISEPSASGEDVAGVPNLGRMFVLGIDERNDRKVHLLDTHTGRGENARPIWSRRLKSVEDREALLARIREGGLDVGFLGRLTTIFGSAGIDAAVDAVLVEVRAKREDDARKAAERAHRHQIVRLFMRKDRRGRPTLELQRASRSAADWQVAYDRAVERDRLCDWMRWQGDRFAEFLDHAASQGDEALTRLLIDEMFATERRIKKEGRSVGGTRPLRMWRGD